MNTPTATDQQATRAQPHAASDAASSTAPGEQPGATSAQPAAAPGERTAALRSKAEIEVALADISGRLDAIQGHIATLLTVEEGDPDGDTSYRLMLLLAFEQALKWALGVRQQPLSDYFTADGACVDALLEPVKRPPA